MFADFLRVFLGLPLFSSVSPDLFFGQFSVNLSDDFFIRFLARFLSRFLARVLTRVLTRVLGRGKIINKAYSTTRP